jgi:hypothetical protein
LLPCGGLALLPVVDSFSEVHGPTGTKPQLVKGHRFNTSQGLTHAWQALSRQAVFLALEHFDIDTPVNPYYIIIMNWSGPNSFPGSFWNLPSTHAPLGSPDPRQPLIYFLLLYIEFHKWDHVVYTFLMSAFIHAALFSCDSSTL